MRLVDRLTEQVGDRDMAIAILKKRGHLDANGNLTVEGKKRQALGAAGRAKDRAAKRSGRKSANYKYNAKTNRATLR